MKTGFSKKCSANKCLLTTLAAFIMLSSIVTMTGCAKTETTLQSVLKEEPVVISIVNTGIDVYNAVDPDGADPQLKTAIDAFVADSTRDLNTLVSIIQAYQSDISAAPAGKLQQADALVASIQAQQSALLAAFHVKSAKAQAEAAAIVDGVQSFLAQLALFLPANAQLQAPATMMVFKTQSAVVGTVKVISPKQLAQKFNAASANNFPLIQVAVPK